MVLLEGSSQMCVYVQCSYTHFKPLDTCISEQHDYLWHDGLKRFFKCPCGNRSISLDRLPKKHCRYEDHRGCFVPLFCKCLLYKAVPS